MSPEDRKSAIRDAIRPFAAVANGDPEAWLTAAERAVPDVDPDEVADAFLALSEELAAEAKKIRDELERRRGEQSR